MDFYKFSRFYGDQLDKSFFFKEDDLIKVNDYVKKYLFDEMEQYCCGGCGYCCYSKEYAQYWCEKRFDRTEIEIPEFLAMYRDFCRPLHMEITKISYVNEDTQFMHTQEETIIWQLSNDDIVINLPITFDK